MKLAPIPPNEDRRIRAVKKLNVLDTPPEDRFDAITKEATERLGVPVSTISILDSDREWYKSRQGIDKKEDERDISFCGHLLMSDEIMIIEDAQQDPWFRDNPHVTKDKPPVRFYAGVTIRDKETRLPVGAFCIKDSKPRTLTEEEIAIIFALAKKAEEEINKKKG